MMNVNETNKTSVNTTRMAARTLCATFIVLLLSASAASAATITVDDSGGADYTSIQAAVDNASGGDVIEVAAGTYYEHVVVNKVLTLWGESNSTTIIDCNGSGNVIEVTANGVTIKGFRIQNGSIGINAISSNNIFMDNVITNMAGTKGADNIADYGIGGTGGISSGIYISGPTNNTLLRNIITNITAGIGGIGGRWGAGGAGGMSSGIHLINTTRNTFTANTINNTTGGTGNTAGVYASGGAGGIACGIYLSNSTDNTLTQNILNNMTGGEGGTGGQYGSIGVAQVGYGIYLNPDSHKNSIDTTNTMDSDPIIYLYNTTGMVIEKQKLTANSNPTNLGKVVIINSINITVNNNSISNMTGQSGQTSGFMEFAQDGGISSGIYLSNTTKSTLINNTITNLTGGTGGTGSLAGAGGTGGKSTAILLSNSNDNTLASNILANLTGGTGGLGGGDSTGGTGGISSGIYFSNSILNTLNTNTIGNITGGLGGIGGTGSGVGSDGAAQIRYGIYLEPNSYNNTIFPTNTMDCDPIIFYYNISGITIADYILTANSNPTNLGKIVLINSSNTTIQNNTISNMTGKTGHTGAYQETAQTGGISSGIYAPNSTKITITGNIISNIIGGVGGTGEYDGCGGTGSISYGIFLSHTTNSTLENNIISNLTGGDGGTDGFSIGIGGTGGNATGIYLIDSTDNTIESNNVSNITGGSGGYKGFTPPNPPGFPEYGPSGTGYSMYLIASTSNLLFHNNLLNTDRNAYDNSLNLWDNGYPSAGNYWSDYSGMDNNSDGIGDVVYNIRGGAGAQDRYPLVQPWDGSNIDTTPPATIKNLNYTSGATWINWTWTNPIDFDFDKVMIYIDGFFKQNISSPINYYNATNLNKGTQYTINTRTIDISSNINQTWVNHTAKTELPGDYSGDSTTDAWDITYLARSITGIPGYDTLSSGDVSGDGVVDAWDCTYLARAIAGVPGYDV